MPAPAGFGWDREAAAYAEIFNILADTARNPSGAERRRRPGASPYDGRARSSHNAEPSIVLLHTALLGFLCLAVAQVEYRVGEVDDALVV